MGGSGSNNGGGWDTGIFIESQNCGGQFRFRVLISSGRESVVWNTCMLGDEVMITTTTDAIPRMAVEIVAKSFEIGVVPPGSSGLIQCIKEGWQYTGTITAKTGSVVTPVIEVTVKGE